MRSTIRRCRAVARSAAAALLAGAALAAAGESTRLVAGRPFATELSGTATASFDVELAAGEFARVAVEPGGVDVAIALVDPEGLRRLRVDDRTSVAGAESLSWISEVAGVHRLEVFALSGTGTATLTLDGPRKPGDVERESAAGESQLAEARSLLAAPTADSVRTAIATLERSLAAWRAVGDRRKQGTVLRDAGQAAVALGDLDAGLARLGEALALAEAEGETSLRASVLGGMAEALQAQGRVDVALVRAEESLAAWRSVSDLNGEAEALTNIGVLRGDLGEREVARANYERAIEIFRRIGNRRSEAAALANLATDHVRAHELDRALELFTIALPMRREIGDRAGEGAILTNLGVVYITLGEHRRALDYLEPALAIWRELGNRRAEAVTLNNLGYAYLAADDPQRARVVLARATELARETGDVAGVANDLVNLAIAHHEIGDDAAALAATRESRGVAREVGDRRVEAATHVLESLLLTNAGDLAGAREHALAGIELRRGEPYMEAHAHHQLARVERAAGDLDAARRELETALSTFERLRGEVSARDLRATFLASVREAYEDEIELLMTLHGRRPTEGLDALALLAAERARARSLLELLTESRAEVRSGVDPELLNRERALREQLSGAEERRLRASGEERAVADRELRETVRQVELVEAEIRARSPRYAELTQLGPRSLGDLQRLLGDGALLLEYSLGERASFLWAVDSSGLVAHRLAPRSEIESLARAALRALAERSVDHGAATAALAEALLGPVARELDGRTLVVVGDGVLHYVPFAALPHPSGGSLASRHEIVALPSAGVLEALRGARSERDRPDRVLAVFADPVFSTDDERLAPAARTGAAPYGDGAPAARAGTVLSRAAEDLGPAGVLPRLPFTRREALALQALVPEGSARLAVDFDASRATALDPELAAYRYVHFATHGLIDDAHPELSGLVLSLVDRDGRPQPGYLTAAEIFNLRLRADLVVLSGCRTGLGREVRGEGLVGLTRGFLYAGADRVVASLWKVDDAATAALMTAFYRGLLGAGKLRPAAALRAAQLELAAEPRFSHPYYWAAFQLVGEWR